MSKFKVGDKVRVIGNSSGHDKKVGDIVEVLKDIPSFNAFECGGGWWMNDCDVGLLDNKNNKMNIKEKFVLALTKEPMKSFRKAGISNGDDLLTEDGQKVFLSWLLNKKFADEFKKEVVDDMLKDLEEVK